MILDLFQEEERGEEKRYIREIESIDLRRRRQQEYEEGYGLAMRRWPGGEGRRKWPQHHPFESELRGG